MPDVEDGLPDCICDYVTTRVGRTVHRMRNDGCPRHGAADRAHLDQVHAEFAPSRYCHEAGCSRAAVPHLWDRETCPLPPTDGGTDE